MFYIHKIKSDKKNILFGATAPSHFIYFKPVYQMLKNDTRIEIWFSGNYMSKDNPEKLYKLFGIKKNVVKERKIKSKHFDLYLCPDYHLIGINQKIKVQFFHGLGIKNFSISNNALKYDKLFILGNYMKKRFIEKGILSADDKRMEMIGMPILDCLVNGTLNKNVIYKKMQINEKYPVVIYAPTWTYFSSLYSFDHRRLSFKNFV